MEDPYIEDLLVNPYYAINFSPNLAGKHEPITTKELWVKANLKLMDQLGREEWLKQLLNVLESGEPRSEKK